MSELAVKNSVRGERFKAGLRKYGHAFKFLFYVMIHPFKGFWDLKHDKRGHLGVGFTVLALYIISQIFFQQFGGFSFNIMAAYPRGINIVSTTFTTAITVLLWCCANWGITTLFNGEGSMRDIFIYTSYSIMPIVLMSTFQTFASFVMSVDESSIFSFLGFLGTFWTGMLLYTGTMTTHQYGAIATFFIILVTVFGMALIAFIAMLFFFLLQQLVSVVYTIYREITMRF